MEQYERHKQMIGRYEVFLRGGDATVIMRSGDVERNMTASEALAFLNWLNAHKGELYKAVQTEDQ